MSKKMDINYLDNNQFEDHQNKILNNHNNIENHKHEHEHDHHDQIIDLDKAISGKKLFFVIILNFIITISEFVGGILSSSLALLSDSLHNFGDTTSVILSWFAINISKRSRDRKKTYGYKRAQIIVAFLNSQFLFIISIFLVVEAIKKFINPMVINFSIMLPIAIIGFIANLISILILHKDSNHSLNIKSSYLHLLGDTLSSIGVIIAAIIIAIFKIYFVDAAMTLLIALYIGFESFKIILKSINILMQSSADLDYEMIKADIESIPNVKSLHHVHTWLTDEKTIFFEAHVELCNITILEANNILEQINKTLLNKYGISHTTIQFEADRRCNKNLFNI